MIREEIEEFYAHYELNTDFVELRNLALISELIIRSALARKESRGLHFIADYPHKIENSQPTVMIPKNTPFTPKA